MPTHLPVLTLSASSASIRFVYKPVWQCFPTFFDLLPKIAHRRSVIIPPPIKQEQQYFSTENTQNLVARSIKTLIINFNLTVVITGN